MARRKRSSTDWSIEDLRGILAAREAEVAELEDRRDELTAELTQVDAELQAVTGTPRRGRLKPGRPAGATRGRKAGTTKKSNTKARRGSVRPGRPGKDGKPLAEFIREVLAKADEPMGPTAIGEAVQSSGYGSKSPNLGVIVSQRLAEMKDVRKAGRGLYSLRGRG